MNWLEYSEMPKLEKAEETIDTNFKLTIWYYQMKSSQFQQFDHPERISHYLNHLDPFH